MNRRSRAEQSSGSVPHSTVCTRLIAAALALIWYLSCQRESQPDAWPVEDLVTELVHLERQTSGKAQGDTDAHLRSFAERALGRRLRVENGRVASVYERGPEWRTRPYFALTYERDSYVYLEDLDPKFQADLADHRFWASISWGAADRQLMFELALSQNDFDKIRPACRVDFSCELAAVIRGGRSVYCRALALPSLDCPGMETR